MGNSEVSIIIPAWKADKWINDCLQSIYDQSWFKDKNNKWETLVGIDNCEETKSATLPKENTKLYYFKEHCGPYVIRNTLALKCAKYDNLIFFDSDDLMHPDLIKDCFKLDEDFITFQLGVFKNKSKQSRGSSFVRKSILSKFGGYDNWICAADNDFIKRIQADNIIWSKLTGQNYMYRRVHENQLTQRSDTGMTSELRKSFHLKTANKLKNNDLINIPIFGEFEEVIKTSTNDNIISSEYKELIIY
jgi:glycosyltransferase involved in cell wall biosynthesis